MTLKLIPTNGKRPEELKDCDHVWVQLHNGYRAVTLVKLIIWENSSDGDGEDVIAYCKAEPPELYVPEPDYSKWVGCLCWVWNRNEELALVKPLSSYDPEKDMPFKSGNINWYHARPLTPDEIRVYLKKAEEACK